MSFRLTRRRILTMAEKIERYKYYYMRSYNVYVTTIFLPSAFFVRNSIFTLQDIKSLERRGRQLELQEVIINTLVIYWSETIGRHIRGRVCKIIIIQESGKKFLIHAIDYGFYDNMVDIQTMFKPESDTSIRGLAVFCQLSHCLPYGGAPWDDNAGNAMRNYIGDVVVKINVQAVMHRRLIVEMKIKSTMANVVQWLITNQFAVPSYPDVKKELVAGPNHKEYSLRVVNHGEAYVVRVQYVSSLTHFHVIRHEDYAQYLIDREIFTSYCEKLDDILPTDVYEGRAVGYKPPGENQFYERAVIQEVMNNGSRTVIFLLDTGAKFEVCHSNLKNVDYMKMREKPAAAIYCSTTDSDEWDYNLREYLEPGFECVIFIRSPGMDFIIPNTVDVRGL